MRMARHILLRGVKPVPTNILTKYGASELKMDIATL